MTRLFLCLLLVGISPPVIAIAEDANEKAIQTDGQRLEGRWEATELVVNGKEQDATILRVINEADGSWRLIRWGKGGSKGTSTIEPTNDPKTIDFTITEGEGKGSQYLGIYELGEDTRKLVFAPADKGRPNEFASKPGSGHILVGFERESAEVRGGEQRGSAASADGDVFTNSDLLRINELFTNTYEFTDNEFIYEEKLKEAVEKASKLAESLVNVAKVVVEVQSVRKEAVNVTFFPAVEGRIKAYPQVRFVEDRSADVQFHSRSVDVGLGGTIISGQQAGRLKVGSLVPVPLAKELRAGDRLKITGTLTKVKPVDLAQLADRKVAGFVVVASDVERVSHDDSEGNEEDTE